MVGHCSNIAPGNGIAFCAIVRRGDPTKSHHSVFRTNRSDIDRHLHIASAFAEVIDYLSSHAQIVSSHFPVLTKMAGASFQLLVSPAPPTRLEMASHHASELRRVIVSLNNKAIACLKEQRAQEAASLLTQGLCMLDVHGHCYRYYCARSFESSSCVVQTPFPHASATRYPISSCCHRRSTITRRPINVRLPERKEQENLPTAIYNRAFILNHDDPMNVSFDMAVLAFNAGLSYQLQGIGSCDIHETKQQALFWYRKAHERLLLEHPSSMRPTCSPLFQCLDREHSQWMTLLAAAVCHNMAAILGDDFWDFGSARLLRCQLAQVIHWEGHQFSQLDTDDFVFFHLVIFFAIIDDFRIAPAA